MMRLPSCLILSVVMFHFVDGQADCGIIALSYFQTGSTVAAKLQFAPSVELSRYKWVHFFSATKPDFAFPEPGKENSSKYDYMYEDFILIIKDLEASDEGVYNIECYLTTEYQLFSRNQIYIQKPYSVERRLESSTSDVTEITDETSYVTDDSALLTATTSASVVPTRETISFTTKTDKKQTTQTSKVTEITTDESPYETDDSALLTATTSASVVPTSETISFTTKTDKEQTTQTSKVTEITTDESSYVTDDSALLKATTSALVVPTRETISYTISAEPGYSTRQTAPKNDSIELGLVVGGGCFVVFVVVVAVAISIYKLARTRKRKPDRVDEERNRHLANVADRLEASDSAHYSEVREHERETSFMTFQTFTKSGPAEVTSTEETCGTYTNLKECIASGVYTEINYGPDTTELHTSTSANNIKRKPPYENTVILNTTETSENEYVVIGESNVPDQVNRAAYCRTK